MVSKAIVECLLIPFKYLVNTQLINRRLLFGVRHGPLRMADKEEQYEQQPRSIAA
jgi:hypothetical protein